MQITVETKNNIANGLEKKQIYSLSQDVVNAWDFICKNKYTVGTFKVRINNLFYSKDELINLNLIHNDLIEIEYMAQDPVSGAIIAKLVITNIVVKALISLAVNLIAGLFINFVMSALTDKGKGKDVKKAETKGVENYGISGGSNEAKMYDSLPIVIGSVRVFPDIIQSPFTDYSYDADNPVLNSTDTPFVRMTDVPVLDKEDADLIFEVVHYDGRLHSDDPPIWYKRRYHFFNGARIYNHPNVYDQYNSVYTWVIVSGWDVEGVEDYPETEPPLVDTMTTFEEAIVFLGKNHPYYSTGNSGFVNDITFRAVRYGTSDTVDFVIPVWLYRDIDPNGNSGSYMLLINSTPLSYPITSGDKLLVLQHFGYYKANIQQRLTQVFNFGLGDLEISDYRIGKTKIDNYKNVIVDKHNYTNTDSQQSIINYSVAGYLPPSFQQELISNNIDDILEAHPTYTYNPSTNSIYTGVVSLYAPSFIPMYSNYQGENESSGGGIFKHIRNTTNPNNNSYDEALNNYYPRRVEVADGGDLVRKETNATAIGDWLIRASGKHPYAIELNISGRLFYLNSDNGEVQKNTVPLELWYREKTSATTFSTPHTNPSAWVKLKDFTLINDTTNTFVYSLYQELPNYYKEIEVAVIKSRNDNSNTNYNEELSVNTINFFQKQTILYPHQQLLTLQIQASGQINGTVDRFSALCNGKTWICAPVGMGSTEFMPEVNGRGWVWGHTRNPAHWFIFFLLGGFKNSNVPSTHPLYNKGWFLGSHPDNKTRLFGAKQRYDLIHWESIIEWADYCDAKPLHIDMLADGNAPCQQTLDDIARVGRGAITYIDGKIGVVFHKKEDPVTFVFHRGNIINDSFNIAFNNELKGDEFVLSYADRDNDFELAYERHTVPNVIDPSDSVDLDLKGITEKSRAIQEVRLAGAALLMHKQVVTLETSLAFLERRRGEVVKIGQDLTKWGISGRFSKFDIISGEVTRVYTHDIIDKPIGTELIMTLMTPSGELHTINVEVESDRTFIPIDTWLDNLAPFNLIDGDNYNSIYLNSYAEDFTYLIDPADSNNRYRIVQIVPTENNTAKVTLVRDIPEYYDYENDSTSFDIDKQDNIATAKVMNMGYISNNNQSMLYWDNVNCSGAILNIELTIGSTVTSGLITVYSDNYPISYPSGASLRIIATPINITTPYMQVSDIFELEV
jgi:hypothetical protein